MSIREHGKVKWFNNFRGYGFITKDNGEDIFVQYSGIHMDGYKTLKEGSVVVFTVVDSEKGSLATEVEVLSIPEDTLESKAVVNGEESLAFSDSAV